MVQAGVKSSQPKEAEKIPCPLSARILCCRHHHTFVRNANRGVLTADLTKIRSLRRKEGSSVFVILAGYWICGSSSPRYWDWRMADRSLNGCLNEVDKMNDISSVFLHELCAVLFKAKWAIEANTHSTICDSVGKVNGPFDKLGAR